MSEKVLEGAAEETRGKAVDAALQNDYVQNVQEEAKVCRPFYSVTLDIFYIRIVGIVGKILRMLHVGNHLRED